MRSRHKPVRAWVQLPPTTEWLWWEDQCVALLPPYKARRLSAAAESFQSFACRPAWLAQEPSEKPEGRAWPMRLVAKPPSEPVHHWKESCSAVITRRIAITRVGCWCGWALRLGSAALPRCSPSGGSPLAGSAPTSRPSSSACLRGHRGRAVLVAVVAGHPPTASSQLLTRPYPRVAARAVGVAVLLTVGCD